MVVKLAGAILGLMESEWVFVEMRDGDAVDRSADEAEVVKYGLGAVSKDAL